MKKVRTLFLQYRSTISTTHGPRIESVVKAKIAPSELQHLTPPITTEEQR